MISRELREFSSSCIGLSVPQRRHESLIQMEGNDFTRIKKIHDFKGGVSHESSYKGVNLTKVIKITQKSTNLVGDKFATFSTENLIVASSQLAFGLTAFATRKCRF